jgi:hypothetical protein
LPEGGEEYSKNNMPYTFLIILLFLVLEVSCPSFVQASLTPFQASPDQVLVLYNTDWQKDVDGSEHGQDSKEVADYYVRMHTDLISGKKPYLLGLRCVHREKHLNQWVIREKSQDNKDGIVFVGKGKRPKSGEWARDSRHVEIAIDPGKELIDWNKSQVFPRKKGENLLIPKFRKTKDAAIVLMLTRFSRERFW